MTILGRTLTRPGVVESGLICLDVQSISSATKADFFFPQAISRYTAFKVRFRSLVFATLGASPGSALQLFFSTDGSTVNTTAVNYNTINEVRYASAAGNTTNNPGNSSIVLDTGATKTFQSATSALVKGIGGEICFDRGGASEIACLTWQFAGAGTATTSSPIWFKGSGSFNQAGFIQGVRIGSSAGLNFSGEFELWAYKPGIPGQR